jgi:hypothetical protein
VVTGVFVDRVESTAKYPATSNCQHESPITTRTVMPAATRARRKAICAA